MPTMGGYGTELGIISQATSSTQSALYDTYYKQYAINMQAEYVNALYDCYANGVTTVTTTGQSATTASGVWYAYPASVTSASASANANWQWVTSQLDQAAQFVDQVAQRQCEVQREATERQRVISIRRRDADARAERLLASVLDEAQLAMYLAHGCFEVPSGKWPNRRYRLTSEWAGNVKFLEGDMLIETLCIHATMSIPMGDHLLSQKLLIEANEDLFRSTANVTSRPGVLLERLAA